MRIFLFIFLCITFQQSIAQRIAVFETQLPANDTSDLIIPVQINLDNITPLGDSSLSLIQVENSKKTQVPFQIYNDDKRWLCWSLQNKKSNKGRLIFELHVKTKNEINPAKSLSLNIKDSMLIVSSGANNLLRYVYKTWYPSTGDKSKDTIFKKSGFIHPLYTPHQQELTRISPPDHPHHYGLWNTWTHVVFESDTVDCWYLGDKKGTVRCEDLIAVTDGAAFSEYKTLNKYYVFKQGTEKVMLNEVQTVRVYAPEVLSNYYIANITIEMSCASDSSVLLKEYRYGGLGWRATEEWDRNNSEVLTSEGKNRKEADGSLARWCIVQGKLGNDYGGAVIMSYPANFNHPEPLRIWPEDIFNRGDMFANFCPTKNKDWLLLPGKTYLLRYQFLVFNDHCSEEKAEAAWHHFASPPAITIKKEK